MKTPKKKNSNITESSGNVFADLGLRNPEQKLLKAPLTLEIYRARRKLVRSSASSSRTSQD